MDMRTPSDYSSQEIFTYRVYDTPTLDVCQRCASSSEAVPRIDAAMVMAAERPPVKAR